MIVPKEYWGASTWVCMYSLAASFDKNTGSIDTLETFYKLLADLIPCQECSAHFKQFIADHDIKTFDDPIDWVVLLNNHVNKRLYKRPVTREFIINTINNAPTAKKLVPETTRTQPGIKIRTPASLTPAQTITQPRRPCNCGK